MISNGVFIAGTDTDVGKTYVTAGLAANLQHKLERPIKLWKPVQSGAALGDPLADSYRLKWGSGLDQEEQDMVSHTYSAPLAPWIAARAEGEEIDFAALVQEGEKRLRDDPFLIVEGAGGLAVPITPQETIAALAQQLQLPMVIVARAGLGTVNHTLLSISHAQQLGIEVIGIVLNNFQPEEAKNVEDNAMMIEQFSGVPVIGKLPYFSFKVDRDVEWTKWRRNWADLMDRNMDLKPLMKWIK